MEHIEQPIFSSVHKEIKTMPTYATIQASSPWKDAEVAFNYVRVDYPKFHTHNHWELLVVLSGSVVHEINNERYTLKKGDACFIRPNDKHRLVQSRSSEEESYKHLNFLIEKTFIQTYLQSLDTSLLKELLACSFSLSFTIPPELLQTIMKKTILMQYHTPPSAVDLSRCKLIINELLGIYLDEFFYAKIHCPTWLSDFLLYLQDVKYFTMPFTELAKFTPYSYSRLTHLFKEQMGITLMDYILNLKLNHAKALLKHSNALMMDIADECHWTLNHFNKIFRAKTGMTPSQYRKSER